MKNPNKYTTRSMTKTVETPTAEEFLESKRIYPHMKLEWECEAVYQAMIEFAKLHVKAAIKQCEALKDCYPDDLTK